MITQLLLNPQLTPLGNPSRLERYNFQKRTRAIGIHLPMSVNLRVLCRGTGTHTSQPQDQHESPAGTSPSRSCHLASHAQDTAEVGCV